MHVYSVYTKRKSCIYPKFLTWIPWWRKLETFTFLEVAPRHSTGLGDQAVQAVRVVRGGLVVLGLRRPLEALDLPPLLAVPVIRDVQQFHKSEAEQASFGLRLAEWVDLVRLGEDCHSRMLYMLGRKLECSSLHRGRQNALL